MRTNNVKFTKVGGADSEMRMNPLQSRGGALADEEEESVVEFHTLEIDSPVRDEERGHGGGGRGGRVPEGTSSRSRFTFSTGVASLDAFLGNAKAVELMAVGAVTLILIIAVIVAATATGHSSGSSGSTADPTFADYRVTTGRGGGAVATDSAPCSAVGVQVLRSGGNAVDAAVAAALCLGVVSPVSSGIGGGCFIVIHSSKGDVFIDSREVAPSAASSDMFEADPLKAQHGGLAVAVPAELLGLHLSWQQHGSGLLSWSELCEPAAAIADGFTVSAQLALLMQVHAAEQLQGGQYPLLSSLYLREDGSIKRQGDTVVNAALARTLRMVGKQGPSYLYDTMADKIAEEIRAAGGVVTAADIRAYRPKVYPALRSEFMGHTYLGAQGSSSGGPVVAGILHYMQSLPSPLVSLGLEYSHWLAESMKHAFAVRLHLADPDFANTTAAVGALLSETFMGALQRGGSAGAVLPLGEYGGKFNLEYLEPSDSGTTHISVLDGAGNAVSLTSTVNTYFGSKVVSASTGVLFNNQMDDFSIPNSPNYFGLHPSPLNYPVPGKRPLSSMAPCVVLREGAVRLVGGASGGPRIITATAQVILNTVGRGMDLLSALVAPRMHSQFLPALLELEAQQTVQGLDIACSPALAQALSDRGQLNVSSSSGSFGVAQFIEVDFDTGAITAVSDPRKDGRPAALDYP